MMLAHRLSQGEAVLAAMTRLTGPCLRLNEAACEAFRRAQRLFFLNEAQDLSRFLVADLGIMRYPEYQVQRVRPVFSDRHALLAYEQGLLHATALDDALEVGRGVKASARTQAAADSKLLRAKQANADLHVNPDCAVSMCRVWSSDGCMCTAGRCGRC